ncbi:hypothetical protein [uncultured Psychroserpens sp.]|uniref:hypothetical protein n=1 Tax=uncultured Psychroserpens sp. TaxID=255436 RepID=UPI00260510BA|nr:hypothetical protein [uncultured Psychroserpens sp.]
MKKIICTLCLFICFSFLRAQENYTVNGETLALKTEVEGQLDLLWNIIDGNYRYFVRTEDDTITELKNTKENKRYQEEYKTLLNELTNGTMSTKRLNLTLFSLKEFIDKYNSSVDDNYESTAKRSRIQFRIGVFGGLTNSPFISNPDNEKTPLFGAELEVLEAERISRHALFIQLRHVLEQDDLMYSTTELSLGYRFRVINKEKFSLYGNVKVATVNFSNATLVTETNGNITSEDINETAFDVPLIFGIGADINVTKNSFITLAYNELFAILIDNQGNFSTDFSIGYKFNL